MFLDFFFLLRQAQLPVSLTEWLCFLEALKMGLHDLSLSKFFRLARATCIKHEKNFDLFDQCFAYYFGFVDDLELPEISKDFENWLKNAKLPKTLSDEARNQLEKWSRERLMEELKKRLNEQTERHDGGNKWVGTGGTSPFGHSGYNPQGIRVGGQSGHKRAVHVASQRKFANLSSNLIIDTRQMSLALKKLRQLARIGSQEELDIDGTLEATANNAGDIELKFQRNRENSLKLILLMDVGGSMTPFTRLSEKLFSAASQSLHFKTFSFYYFHNCPYEFLYTDIEQEKKVSTSDVLQKHPKDSVVIWMGDAAMSPYELLSVGGSVDYFHHNERPGIEWLNEIASRFQANIWLNPLPQEYWTAQTTHAIASQLSMYPLTLDGLEDGVRDLKRQIK